MKIQYIKNKGLSVLMIVIMASIVSCEKMIEIPANPPDQIAESALFADSSNIMSAVAGIYAGFKIPGGGTNFFNGMITINMAYAADEMIYAYGSAFQTNTYTATETGVSTFWTSAYENIYRINACITGISSTDALSSSLKESLLGELKVLRALNYFYLVNLFDGVPLVTSIDYNINATLPRSTVDEVYELIISDLTDARGVLTEDYPSAGRARPNLYVADALLARVYLYREQYADAEAMASEVINSGQYSLPGLNDVFLDGSNEAIWQLPAVGTNFQTYEGYTLMPYSQYSKPNNQILDDLLDSFEPDDQRKTSWINISTAYGGPFYYTYKYKNRNYEDTPAEGYMFLRFAEQYLIRAEARAKQGGTDKLSGAEDDLNVVRERAGLADTTATTQEAMLELIMNERRTELFCEWGHRWFDLRRTGTIDEVLASIKSGWVSTSATLPIPFKETQNNPFLTQNTGY